MARLRRNEEARSYAAMTSKIDPSSPSYYYEQPRSNEDDDEMTYTDASRQVTLIFNVLISIVACGAAIWMVAKWWSTPARLAISMSGALLVGAAEVVVYSGYLRRLGEAKVKEKGVKEVKEIIGTWSVGGGKVENREDDGAEVELVGVVDPAEGGSHGVRERKVKKLEDKT
jgi:hypothetical protein